MWQMADRLVCSEITKRGTDHTHGIEKCKHLHMHVPCLQTAMTSPLIMRLPTCVRNMGGTCNQVRCSSVCVLSESHGHKPYALKIWTKKVLCKYGLPSTIPKQWSKHLWWHCFQAIVLSQINKVHGFFNYSSPHERRYCLPVSQRKCCMYRRWMSTQTIIFMWI